MENKFLKITSPVIRLDSYIEENKIQCIDILKIDIEGKELEALESLGKYLTNNFVKIIKIEISFKDKTYFQSVNTFLCTMLDILY